MSPQRTFLVEAYAPATSEFDRLLEQARLAAAGWAAGESVRHVRSILVPEDETCFHLYEAESASDVADAMHSAEMRTNRIVEVSSWAAEGPIAAPG